jgi:hypothetical protein
LFGVGKPFFANVRPSIHEISGEGWPEQDFPFSQSIAEFVKRALTGGFGRAYKLCIKFDTGVSGVAGVSPHSQEAPSASSFTYFRKGVS